MKQFIVLLAASGCVAMTGCTKGGGGGSSKASLDSDDDKTIYAIGVDMGTKLQTLDLSSKEMAVLKMGIDDGSNKDAKPKVEPREFLSKVGELIRNRQKAYAEKEKKEATAFIEKAAGMDKATKTDSGLVYIEKEAGSGESPKASDRVKVNYHGTLRSGDVFDSTKERNQPATFRLDRVIKCWNEGVQKMKVGGKAELYCPPEIAYGDRGAPPKIPPGSALKFEVELLEIVKNEEGGKKGDKKKAKN
jgi:FKBP-type peptidyl-prolyl cis-trans isomerase FkpA